MQVHERMIRNVVTIERDLTSWDALELMVSRSVRRLPVVDAGRVVGMVTERDIQATVLRTLADGHLLAVPLEEAMARDLVTVTPQTALAEAIRLMMETGCGGLPVVDGEGRLLGLLTRSDVFKVIIEREEEFRRRTNLLQRKVDERTRALQTLMDVMQAATSSIELEEAVKAIIGTIHPVVGFERAGVLLVERDGLHFTVYALVSRPAQGPEGAEGSFSLSRGERVPIEGTVSGWVLRQGQTRVVVDLEHEQDAFPQTSVFDRDGMRSAVVTPLMVGGSPIGVLALWTPAPDAFSETSRIFIERVAGQVAAAIHHAEMYRREREAVEKLREVNRIKDELLAIVSHDLRSPLTAVLAYGHMLKKQKMGPIPEAYQAVLKELDASGGYMLGLLDDLLDVARLGYRGLRLEKVPMDLRAAAAEVVDSMHGQASAASVDLVLRDVEAPCDDGPPVCHGVVADPRRVRQVVMNLVTNAIKFNRPGGRVELRVTGAGPEVQVEVEDTGSGIVPEEVPHVFDMFRRLEQHRKIEGSGLGLAITRELVELHGGRISVRSELGKGSCFTFCLPREVPTPHVHPAGGHHVVPERMVVTSLAAVAAVPPCADQPCESGERVR